MVESYGGPAKSRKQDRTYRTVIAGFSLGLFVYVLLRAVRVPLTIDEAATYLRYLSADFWALFDLSVANNHFLNTILAKAFILIGGDSEFVLRLPNLLGYSLYLLFSYRIASRFDNKLMAVGGFLFLNAHPYLLDYFSLCRGYGLSLAFVLGAAHFYISFLLKRCRHEENGMRDLAFALGMAALSVMANFTLLNFYLPLLAWTVVLLAIQNAREKRPIPPPAQDDFPFLKGKASKTTKIFFSLLGLGAVFFNIQMVFLDARVSPSFFEPVAVGIQGLSQEEKIQTSVFGVALGGKEVRFMLQHGTWKSLRNLPFRDIKFSLPLSVTQRIEKIEILIGGVPFVIESAELKNILGTKDRSSLPPVFDTPASISLKKSIFPHFRQITNWSGDGNFIRLAALKAAAFFGIAGFIVFLVFLLGRGVVKWKILKGTQYATIASITLGLIAFAAYPLYLLKTTDKLTWGGHKGFIETTILSLINRSFYRRSYLPHQSQIVFFLVLLSILVFVLVTVFQWKKRSCAELLPGASVLGILCLISLSVILQHAIFQTLYLQARTALFFIPLYWLFLILALDFLGGAHRLLKPFSISVLVVILLGLGVHFFQTANTSLARDWPSQAHIKSMLRDLEEIREREWPRYTTMKLGISKILYPQSIYYIRRYKMDWIDAQTGRKARGADFFFSTEKFDRGSLVLIKRYPPSNIILVRPRNPG